MPEQPFETSFGPIEPAVQADLQSVHSKIRQILSTEKAFLSERLAFLLEHPGKMLRPLLLLLSARACGSVQSIHIDLAAIIELIHTATLLHDDVVDRAVLRRGRPSANALWGNTAAVLLGDFLLSRALVLGAQLHSTVLSEQILQTAQQICEGELLQNYHRRNWQMDETLYQQIISAKTASLFAASCMLGASWAQADNSAVEALTEYGRYFGLAFQIRDDVLDLFSSEEKTGKTIGTDLAEGKPTLPLILWLKTLPESEKQQVLESLNKPRKQRELVRRIRASSIPLQILQHLQQLKDKACRCLNPLPDTPAKNSLLRAVEAAAELSVLKQ
jgi:octaprenyl-diphosphate synthase